jgi:hypothetical protein
MFRQPSLRGVEKDVFLTYPASPREGGLRPYLLQKPAEGFGILDL